MTDAIPAATDAAQSQIIEHRDADVGAQGRGADIPQDKAPETEAKPLSSRDAISKAFDEATAKADAEKDAPKSEKQPLDDKEKAEEKRVADDAAKVDTDKKPAKAEEPAAKAEPGAPAKDAAGRDDEAGERQSEGRKHVDPPARFLPEARAKWANTPNEIKAEMHRVSEEYETRIQETKQHADKYEAIRHYDELSERNGRGGIKGVLDNLARIEDAMQRNPIAGLDMVLRESGSKYSLHDIARHVAQMNPQQIAQSMQQAPQQQQQQKSPEIEGLRKELDSFRAEIASAKVAPVVEQFGNSHPDFHQLEGQIAAILRSGVIEEVYGTGLTTGQKLEQAYRMAGGQGPASQSTAPEPEHSQATPARPVDPDGQKSIKGAPASAQSGEAKRKFKSNRDALAAAFADVR